MNKKEVIHMQGVTNALLNMILVSIPEETVIAILTLIFLKRFDMLDIRMLKYNLKILFIPILPVAIIVNLFRYVIIIPRPIMSLSAIFLMSLLLVYIIIKNSYTITKRVIIKTIIFTVLSFIIVGLVETLYYPITLIMLHKEMAFFDNNILYNFLISLPGRILEVCIISYIIVKRNNQIPINLFNTVIKNKFFTNSFIFIMVLSLFVIIYMAKLIIINNIFNNLNLFDQLIINIIVMAIPTILITWFLIFINYLLIKEKQIQQTYENLVTQDDVMLDVED